MHVAPTSPAPPAECEEPEQVARNAQPAKFTEEGQPLIHIEILFGSAAGVFVTDGELRRGDWGVGLRNVRTDAARWGA